MMFLTEMSSPLLFRSRFLWYDYISVVQVLLTKVMHVQCVLSVCTGRHVLVLLSLCIPYSGKFLRGNIFIIFAYCMDS